MAMRLVEAGAAPGIDGAVLIAGAGHARRDRGVPLRLSDLAPGATVLSVGFIQVSAERRDPTDYAAPLHAPALPFDFVLFTPRADVEDPCSKYGEGLRRLGDK
jgi:hypothetical protein